MFNITFSTQPLNINVGVEGLKLESLAELLFVLASTDRLQVLSCLREEKWYRLTDIAQKLDSSMQEASKHVARLREQNFIEKDTSNGCYTLTTLGKLITRLLPSIEFLSENKEYLLIHDISSLPEEFIERIGELQEHRYNEKVGLVLSFTHQVIREADKFIWLMSDHSLIDVFDIERDKNRRITWRIILPKGSKIDWQGLRSYAKNVQERIEIGFSHDIIAGIALNEKVAGVLLPDLKGNLDFNSSLISSSVSFRKWCQDLFDYIWNGSERTIL
jgi:predicted transcriptional regulator